MIRVSDELHWKRATLFTLTARFPNPPAAPIHQPVLVSRTSMHNAGVAFVLHSLTPREETVSPVTKQYAICLVHVDRKGP
jgi:hypothetical protein